MSVYIPRSVSQVGVLKALLHCPVRAESTLKSRFPNLRPFEEIPGFRVLPMIGSAWVYFPIVGKYSVQQIHIADREKYKIYGDIVREKFGQANIVSCFIPEVITMLFENEGQYPSRGEFSSIQAYRELRRGWYASNGLVALQGKEWYDLRSKTNKHLMNVDGVREYLPAMQDVAKDMVYLIRYLRNHKKEVPDLLPHLYKWALESIAVVGLDARLDCLNPYLTHENDGWKMIDSVQTQLQCINKLEALTGNFQFWKYLPSRTWRKFVNASDVFTEIAFKYINQSVQNLKNRRKDSDLTLLQRMIADGLDVSRAMVMVADMLMAGIDTTSHTLGFLLYHLARNPEKQELLYQEIKSYLPERQDKITKEMSIQFPYFRGCLKEAMRLDPVVRGNLRVLKHDVVIANYEVPAGTAIMCVLQVIYRNEKYFSKPNEFLPERWLDRQNRSPYVYAFQPFGSGRRICIGKRLAELEILCLCVEIIRNFKVEYLHEDIGMYTKLVNSPDKPLRFKFTDR